MLNKINKKQPRIKAILITSLIAILINNSFLLILYGTTFKNKTTDNKIKETEIITEAEIIAEAESTDNNMITFEKFSRVLPEKYKYNISSKQGLRKLTIRDTGGEPLSTNQKWHQGLDIACPDKTEVYADKEGYIAECYPGYYNGSIWKGHRIYGGMLIINHFDGTISLYAHLSRTDVREGDYVTRGQLIGLSGGVKGRRASGQTTGPHLHYSVYLNMDDIFCN